MLKMGMIGGLGPESTLDYYKLIIEMYRKEIDTNSNPEIIINSLDIHKLLRMVESKEWDQLTKCLVDGIESLHKAGADFAFISANTPHIVFNQVQELSPILLISIVEATCNKVQSIGIKKVGLLGTRLTMSSKFYQEVFDKHNIDIVLPNEAEQQYIHSKIFDELELGIFTDQTRAGLLNIIKRLIEAKGIEGVILGCTELPLILTHDSFGIPFINTTKVHVESVISYCRRKV